MPTVERNICLPRFSVKFLLVWIRNFVKHVDSLDPVAAFSWLTCSGPANAVRTAC
jgi:hypothetical protein